MIFNPENAQWMVAQMALGTRVAGYVVNVNWNGDDRKWNVNAWKLDDDNWNAGNRAFSRNSHGSPLKGMKAGAESNQEAKDMHALIKVKFNEGDYVAAQKLANEYTQAVTAAFRTESSVAKN